METALKRCSLLDKAHQAVRQALRCDHYGQFFSDKDLLTLERLGA